MATQTNVWTSEVVWAEVGVNCRLLYLRAEEKPRLPRIVPEFILAL